MGKNFKSFDFVSVVINRASEKFAPIWKQNDENTDVLRQYCAFIDKAIKEFDCESLEVDVDEISMRITISLECMGMVIEESSHYFYKLLERTLAFKFEKSKELKDGMRVSLVFPKLWDKAI